MWEQTASQLDSDSFGKIWTLPDGIFWQNPNMVPWAHMNLPPKQHHDKLSIIAQYIQHHHGQTIQ